MLSDRSGGCPDWPAGAAVAPTAVAGVYAPSHRRGAAGQGSRGAGAGQARRRHSGRRSSLYAAEQRRRRGKLAHAARSSLTCRDPATDESFPTMPETVRSGECCRVAGLEEGEAAGPCHFVPCEVLQQMTVRAGPAHLVRRVVICLAPTVSCNHFKISLRTASKRARSKQGLPPWSPPCRGRGRMRLCTSLSPRRQPTHWSPFSK